MNPDIIVGLIYNVSLLLALAMLFDVIASPTRAESLRVRILVGLVIGVIGIAVMFTHWELLPGVIFDTRSILLAITGVYFGFVPTLIVVVITAALRIALGGGGVFMGVGVILTSAGLGLTLRHVYRRRIEDINWREILALGIAVHVVMLLWTGILPQDIRWLTFKNIVLPVLILYPMGTVLLGKLFEQNLKRRIAMTRVRVSEEQLKESQRIAHLGSYVFNYSDGRWSGSLILDEIFGIDQTYPRTVDSWLALIHPDDREMMLNHFRIDGAEVPGLFDKEYRMINHRSGEVCWVNGLGKLDLDDNGVPFRMVGTIQDISARKNIELAQHKSETKFGEIFNNTNDSIFIFPILANQTAGNFIEVNEMACQKLGYTRAELIKMSPPDISVPDPDQYLSDILETVISNEKHSVELSLRARNGKKFPVEINTHSFELADEHVVLAVVRDISRRRQLEEEYRQAQKMESVGRLAGGIAHDFNNMLTVINGYSEILLSQYPPGEKNTIMLEQINKAGQRAARLTNQLLAFSRKQILRVEVLNLNAAVEELHDMLDRLIGEQIRLTVKLAQDLPLIKADIGQLEQMIINLAVNARDAMPDGGMLTLETSFATLDQKYVEEKYTAIPGDYVLLAVSDTGIGIEPEIQEKIFEPFFTTKSREQGTGLGLSMVHGIVNQLGGNIWVYSEMGVGTTFKIYLPIVHDGEVIQIKEVKYSGKSSGNESILVVEDETVVREMAYEVLSEHGYTVYVTPNGEEALKLFKSGDFKVDLVLTDVIMPLMNGNQLVEALKAMGKTPDVIYMSGYTTNAIVHHGILEDGINFIQKPFAPHHLLSEVRRILDQT